MKSNLTHIQALEGYCLIEPLDETEEIKGSTGSFQIADQVKDAESQRIGKVLSIGGPIKTVYGAVIDCPKEVKVGSLVFYKQIAYDRFKYKEQSIKFIAFNDIVGLINE